MGATAAPGVAIRPAAPADAPALAELFGGLSAATVERRYFAPRLLRGEAARREAARLTQTERGHIVLVAAAEGGERIVAVGELAPYAGEPGVAEGAMLVADAYQGRGIGRAVAEQLAQAAEGAAIRRVRATTSATNTAVRRLIASLGRPYSARFAGAEVQYELGTQ
jgi:RimJ/RimL family protein N-acetyltransferase